MITISQEAQEFLRGIECLEGKVLRLEEAREPSGKRHARFRIAYPKDDDEVLERDGETLLHVARSAGETFDGCVVTRVEMEGGGRHHPVAAPCGSVLLVAGSGRRHRSPCCAHPHPGGSPGGRGGDASRS